MLQRNLGDIHWHSYAEIAVGAQLFCFRETLNLVAVYCLLVLVKAGLSLSFLVQKGQQCHCPFAEDRKE